MNYTTILPSPIGDITLCSDGTALTGLWFEGQKHFASTLSQPYQRCNDLSVFADTRRWLNCYFGGGIPTFLPALNLIGTPFRQKVWQMLLAIPYSHTASYSLIANTLGCASARAVGNAVAHNPVSIIVPCHRVVPRNGTLGSYAGGNGRKAWLLQLENGAQASLSPISESK